MPMYICFRGSISSFPQDDDIPFFGVEDGKGRTWYCQERDDAPDPAEIFRLGRLAGAAGDPNSGQYWHGNAKDEDELKGELSNS